MRRHGAWGVIESSYSSWFHLARIHSLCLDDRSGGRRPKVPDERLCSVRLFAICCDSCRIDDFPLHFGGESAHNIETRVVEYIDKEHREVAFALCDRLDDLSRGRLRPGLCFHLLTNT